MATVTNVGDLCAQFDSGFTSLIAPIPIVPDHAETYDDKVRRGLLWPARRQESTIRYETNPSICYKKDYAYAAHRLTMLDP
jgi:hypothetical protein